jgi:flagellar M-ring protein FliF
MAIESSNDQIGDPSAQLTPQRYLEAVTNSWRGLPSKRRAVVSGSVIGALAVLALGVTMGLREDYALLYGNLELEEAGRIASALKDRQVSYRVVDGGRIEVPRAQVTSLRAELAMQGMPSGGVGYELFDKQSPFGLSEFGERIAFERARSGELARTISALEQVDKVSVHIVEPEASIFKGNASPARASVVLRLHPGARLSTSQVEGITRIVAGAVTGLALEHVSVLDERGNPLGSGATDGSAGGGLELQASVEEALILKAQAVLLAVVGRGGAVVKISAEVELDQIDETVETFDIDNKVTRRENTTSRESSGPTGAGGATGAEASVSGDTASKGKSGTSETEETSEVDYLVPRTLQKIRRPGGAVKRLSVALLVSDTYGDRLAELERLVKRAIGFDESRGDSFEAVATILDPGELSGGQSLISQALLGRIIEGGISLLAIGVLLVIVRSLRPKKLEDEEDPVLRELELRAKKKREAHAKQVQMLEEELQERERHELIASVQQMVAAHPRVASEVLRRWLYMGELVDEVIEEEVEA